MIAQLKRKTTAVAAAIALTTVMAAPAAAQRPSSNPLTVPVVGTVLGGGSFVGTLAFARFAVENGQVVARGTLAGILTNAAGVPTTVLSTLAVPLGIGNTTCQILHLDLGPIFLDLLGLQVNLSRVVLDITAQSGAGNLLGNLLCGVARLLDNPNALAGLLNRIFDILGGL